MLAALVVRVVVGSNSSIPLIFSMITAVPLLARVNTAFYGWCSFWSLLQLFFLLMPVATVAHASKPRRRGLRCSSLLVVAFTVTVVLKFGAAGLSVLLHLQTSVLKFKGA